MYYPGLPASWRVHNLSCMQPAEVMKPLRLCSRLSRLLKANLRHDGATCAAGEDGAAGGVCVVWHEVFLHEG